jgi:hypothetical protein
MTSFVKKYGIGYQNNTDYSGFGSFKIPNWLDFVLNHAILSPKTKMPGGGHA